MKIKDIVISEAVLKAYDGKQATIDDPENGQTINLDMTKPENAAALKPNDKGELEYDSTPDSSAMGAGNPESPLKPGAQIAIKADEGSSYSNIPPELCANIVQAIEQDGMDVMAALNRANKETNGQYRDNFKSLIRRCQRDAHMEYDTQGGDITPFVLDTLQHFAKAQQHHNDVDETHVGGDATDQYIDDVTDKQFDNNHEMGMRESRTSSRSGDDALLASMLTIAGLR